MTYLPLEEIGERVRDYLEERNLSQYEMADRLGVSQPVVSDALSGKPNQRNTLFRIARELGCGVEEVPHYRFEEPSTDI